MSKHFFFILFIVFGTYSGFSLSAQRTNSDITGELIVFHAGSLTVPLRQIAAQFEEEYPNVNVMLEAAGSRTCARKITDLKRRCDVLASADYSVIDNLLIPEYADWSIKFAGNEMAIVYTEKSRYAEGIDADNWYEILLKDDVAFGRSDPDSDPCGYRAVQTMKLAERHYGKRGLANEFLRKDVNNIRPKEMDLLVLLEMNQIDYLFLYRSVAVQMGLKFIVLPDEINLKNPELADVYATVSVNVAGKKPGAFIAKVGEPMIYGVTIPKNAPNPETATVFVEFLLTEDKGMAIMKANGQESIVPSETDRFENIPDSLKQFALREE